MQMCGFFFFGDSKADVLRRKLSKLYDRAKQSRQGSALVNLFINVLFERGRLFKSWPVKGCQTRVLVVARTMSPRASVIVSESCGFKQCLLCFCNIQ